jgi:hypothetical protein
MQPLLYKNDKIDNFDSIVRAIENSKTRTSKRPSKHKFRKLFKKTHRYLGLALSILILNFAISGIILEHRNFFSTFDIPRKILPTDYQFRNWNNAAVKGNIQLQQNINLIYGAIGVWKEENGNFQDFNQGFPKGADNYNIQSLYKSNQGNLYAGTLFNFYFYNQNKKVWQKMQLPTKEQRVVKILENNGKIYLLTRSNFITMNDNIDQPNFQIKQLKAPFNYKKQNSLFQTLWQIHNGSVFGIVGRFFMDLMALVFIFLVITGIIKWYFPKTYKKIAAINKSKLISRKKLVLQSLHWHNKVSLWTIAFLIISTVTGMFLRPPLLILIADSKVAQINGTHLSQDNAWYDRLRNFVFFNNKIIFATDEEMYSVNEDFSTKPIKFNEQPPISVMGVNVLENKGNDGILVGSFTGLFLWDPVTNQVFNYVTKAPYIPVETSGPPVGDFKVSGFGKFANNKEYYFDYDLGAVPLNSDKFYYKMPNQIINESKISLWNLALEFHTARIFQAIIGDFYILIIPLGGLLIFFTLISGLIVWFLLYYGKKLIK